MKRTAALLLILMLALCAGCSSTYRGQDVKLGAYSIRVPDHFKVTDPAAKLPEGVLLYRSEKGKLYLQAMTVKAPDLKIDANTLSGEIKEDSYMKPGKPETVEMKGLGTAYGLTVKDQSTGMEYAYYKLKIGDDAVSMIYAAEGSLSEENKKEAKAILASLKK